jgi:hypothetical protein
MKNMLLKIFGTGSDKIPEYVKNQLLQEFPDAINVDWNIKDDYFEAVFYVNETEYIAKISKDSGFTGYKMNLKLDELPELIIDECQKSGEIMNAIVIHAKTRVLYEVITRDRDFNRTLLLLSQSGELLESTRI